MKQQDPKQIEAILSQTLPQYMGVRDRRGHIGIEVEIETVENAGDVQHACLVKLDNLSNKGHLLHWNVVGDGSLRNGLELVLRGPMDIKLLPEAMQQFDTLIKPHKTVQSIRTSVHYHVNATTLKMRQLARVIGSYFLYEPLLIATQPKTRQGNLFCLAGKDAEWMIEQFTEAWKLAFFNKGSNIFNDLCHEQHRYGALNMAAIRKFGSLEFRFVGGTVDSGLIAEWAGLFNTMVTNLKAIPIAEQIEAITSEQEHQLKLMERVFGQHTPFLLKTVGPTWSELLQRNLGYGMIFSQIEHTLNSPKKKPMFKPTIVTERDDPVERDAAPPPMRRRDRRDPLNPGAGFRPLPMPGDVDGEQEEHDDLDMPPEEDDWDPDEEMRRIEEEERLARRMDEMVNPPAVGVGIRGHQVEVLVADDPVPHVEVNAADFQRAQEALNAAALNAAARPLGLRDVEWDMPNQQWRFVNRNEEGER